MEQFDVIIIGAGPAGITASIYAYRAGLNAILFDKGAIGGKVVDAYEIENYPGFNKINGSDLALSFRNQIKSMGINFKRESVTKIEQFADRFYVDTNKAKYLTKRIIIATGTEETKMNLENEEKFKGRGVSYCATCDGAYYQNKDVVVYGGGDSAVTEAAFLAKISKSVTVISRHDLRGEKQNILKLFEYPNVKHIKNTTITALNGDDSLESIDLINLDGTKSNLKTDGLFVYIGAKPNLSYLNRLNILDKNGYINVDDHFRTQVKNIYAIGDVINKELRQIVTATNDGAEVIHTILKENI